MEGGAAHVFLLLTRRGILFNWSRVLKEITAIRNNEGIDHTDHLLLLRDSMLPYDQGQVNILLSNQYDGSSMN
jgi:hypothetical protein